MEMECLLCLQTTNSVFNIFEELKEGSVILDIPNIIEIYIPFEIDEDNPMLCGKCWNTIKSFHIFCLQIEEAHKNSKRKKQEINKSVFNDKTKIDIENVINEHVLLDNNDIVDVDVSQNGCVEILEIEYCDSNTDISLPECTKINYKTEEKLSNKSALYKFTNKNLKIKIKKLKTSYSLDNKCNDMQSTNNFKMPSALSEKIKTENCDRKEGTKLISEIKDKEEFGIDGSSKISKIGENIKRRRNKKSKSMVLEQSADAADEKIAKYMTLSCELCDEKFTTFAALKSHYHDIHQQKGYATCCGYKFSLRYLLLDHIEFHLNPANFKCHLCDKAFTVTNYLKKHMKEMHETDRKVFNCDQCPKKYIDKKTFVRHKATHLPIESWEFSCEECEKIFPSKFYLWSHKRLQHKNKTGICDICGKVYSKKHYKRHMETHDSNYRAVVQCHICKKILRKKTIKVHLKNHEEAEADEEYICPTCGKKSPNKTALYSHMYYIHRINKTHNCTICDKSFKTKAVLLQHIPMHTDESNYKCEFCNRLFKSKAALYTHKKKKHKVELEKRTVTKQGRPPVTKKNMKNP